LIGRQLAHFRITAKLGEGGMGEVYRAEDTKLGREVAIKVLPAALTGDADRLARFEREARVLAALNHPHIASIYEVGQEEDLHFLVMELAPGASLAERLAGGALALEEALSLARQIAQALEVAHEQGIVHRDLKPANVQVSDEGRVKVLDFGLAKAFESETPSSAADRTRSPTLTQRATQAGVLLGTAAYMSPEQARGKPADRRSDVWAFGALVWEMLTGRRLFGGETTSDSLAAVLRAEPSWDELPAGTPASIRRLLRRCLERDPARRLQHIGDARLELDDAASGEDDAGASAPVRAPASRWRVALPWLAAVAAALAAILGWIGGGGDAPPPRATHLSLVGGGFHPQSNAAISADGRHVAYTDYMPTFNGLLHVRSLDSGDTVTLTGTEGARMPFFSPDGAWLAFSDNGTNRLLKVPTDGGSPTRLALVSGGVPTGSWGENGTLVFSDGLRDGAQYEGLMVVGENGGDQEVLTVPEPHEAHHQPLHLPGKRWLLFVVSAGDGDDRIEALSLDDGRRHVVLEDATTPRFSSGHLLFYRPSSREVLAVRMTLDPPAVGGSVRLVARDVPSLAANEGAFTASPTGTLLRDPATSSLLDRYRRRVFAVPPGGEMVPLDVPPQDWTQPRVSPDGRSLLLRQAANPDCVLWLHDLERRTTTRLTFDVDAHSPLWHPGGDRLAFSSDDGEQIGVVAIGIDGSRDRPELLVDGRSEPEAWSADGRWLVYSTPAAQDQADLWILDTETGERRAFLSTRFDEATAALSPDGRWLAYSSDESGLAEVYVRAFPGGDHRVQLSSAGGSSPVWAPDASRLYYLQDNGIAVARFDPDAGAPLGASERVFSSDLVTWARDTPYDLLPDGSLVVIEGEKESDRPPEMTVVLDWARDLGTPDGPL
jgi:Tol biopolymer transport system component